MAEQKSPEKDEKKAYTYQDLIKFSNTEIYSAFGEMRESNKPSAPHFAFGTSTRDAEPKKFVSKEMAVVDCFGKQTPKGPNYNVHDKFNYNKGPEWKIGTFPRNTLDTKAKYEHYFRKDVDVPFNIFSLTSMKQIEQEKIMLETPVSEETQGYLFDYLVPTRPKEVQNDTWTRVSAQSQARNPCSTPIQSVRKKSSQRLRPSHRTKLNL